MPKGSLNLTVTEVENYLKTKYLGRAEIDVNREGYTWIIYVKMHKDFPEPGTMEDYRHYFADQCSLNAIDMDLGAEISRIERTYQKLKPAQSNKEPRSGSYSRKEKNPQK